MEEILVSLYEINETELLKVAKNVQILVYNSTTKKYKLVNGGQKVKNEYNDRLYYFSFKELENLRPFKKINMFDGDYDEVY